MAAAQQAGHRALAVWRGVFARGSCWFGQLRRNRPEFALDHAEARRLPASPAIP